MNKVVIFQSSHAYEKMFKDNGWEVVENLLEADLGCFTGGEDVFPGLYGERPIPETMFCHRRDQIDRINYSRAQRAGLPLVGICRGAQFLNVMSGGKLWQDVDNHAVSNGHRLIDLAFGRVFTVSSTHHQMMRPSLSGTVFGIAGEAKRLKSENEEIDVEVVPFYDDIEVVYYPDNDCLCFQPHPEHFTKAHPCQEYFFQMLEHCLL